MTQEQPSNLEPSIELMMKGLDATSCGVTIADLRLPDEPLIYVNPAFERITGYDAQEVLGKNCRFLQGQGPRQLHVSELRSAIGKRKDCTVVLQNYRKDGTPFWNELFVSPVADRFGDVTHFIGVQTDVTRRVESELALQTANELLEQRVAERTAELLATYDATLEGWGKALEIRDQETEGHSQRVTAMALRLATAMGVSDDELIHIRHGALLHDIGKIGIPDSILLKPGKLTDEERETMQRHPAIAFEWLRSIQYLQDALSIPYSHHEKWDGSGYPLGLVGEQIPLAARIFAVVDVWDALRSDRPYRKGWPELEVIEYIEHEAGSHFDPAVVKACVSLLRTDRWGDVSDARAA